MNKYPLGRDILVSWSLDLGGQPVNIAGCDFVFEYSTAGGSVRVPSTDYTIDNNILSWTFRKEDQHAYGLYSLRLLAFDDGSLLAEFRDKAAFEIVHGTPSEEAQTLAMQSSVETTQESESEPEEETSDEVDNYVSRSPLYVEKVPLGSNLVVNWKLLSAADFDFPLDECELRLFYSAAGSGCQEAEDYELVSDNGYSIQWNFAGDKQVRFGMYSLFLDIYYQGARIATFVREDGFDLVHRKASDILTDRIIDFESVVTTFGGGALYMLTDILNDGYSTVYRSNGTTPAANGDVLRYNGEKWYAAQAGDLTASLENEIAALWLDSAGLHTRVADAEGNISTLTQTAAGFDLRVANVEGDVGDLQLTATALTARMTNAEGDIGLLELTATGLTTRITNAEGDIGSLELTATGLTTRISNAEGDISTLTQTATSLTSRIVNAEGDISVLEQTASGLQYQVSNQAGDIATLQVSARGLTSRVSNAEGDISVLEQTADSLTSRITNAEGDISTLTQTAERIGLQVQGVDDELARYETITDSTIETMQRQIDGAIETWFYMGAPTMQNQPAVNWSYSDYADHEGDLYYDKLTGYAYRFMRDDTVTPAVYSWGRITDVDVTKALADAAHAQATADGKMKWFSVQPYPPYHLGDLWIRSDGTIYKCIVEKPNDDDVFAASDWSSSDFAPKMVVKANFDVLANAIIGTVAGYDADGKITSATATQFEQSIDRISFSVAKVGSALLPTGINIADEIITIRSNNFVLAGNGVGDPAALTITYRNNVPYISASNLDITGILSTNEWTAEEAILNGYADNAAGGAETAAKDYAYNYANSTEYLNGVIQGLINNSISGKADDANYAYLRTALDNKTAVLGGLLLTSLIQLGATESGGSWTVRAGISGVYDTTKLGNGIAAWYGGPMTDWKSLTEQQRLTTPFAKSLFRMDGSGYLASGEIQWGSAGDIILHGVGIESAALDEQTTLTDGTTTFRVEDLILLRSWFSIDYYLDSSSQRHYYLKLNASGSDGTAIEGFVSNGFISAGGISGGGGQAGGNASLSNITSVSTGGYKGDISASGVGSLTVYDTAAVDAKVAGAANLQKVWASLQNNDNVTTYDSYKIHTNHLPTIAGTGITGTYSTSGTAPNLTTSLSLSVDVATILGYTPVAPSALNDYVPLAAGSSYPLTGCLYAPSIYLTDAAGVDSISFPRGHYNYLRAVTAGGKIAFITDGKALTGTSVDVAIGDGWMAVNNNVNGAAGYNMYVNGTFNATTIYQNGTTLANSYLSLGGGTLTGNYWDLLSLNRTNGHPYIVFKNNGTTLGYIGYEGNTLRVTSGSNITQYTVYHSGNANSVSFYWNAYAVRFNSSGNSSISSGQAVSSSLSTDDIAIHAHDGSNYTIIRAYCSDFQIQSTLTTTGDANVPHLNITNTAGSDEITFARGGYNYLRAKTSGGTIAFITNGKSMVGNSVDFAIGDSWASVNNGANGSAGYNFYVNGTLDATTIYQNGVALGARAFDSTAYLPLTGGTIENASNAPFHINNTTTGASVVYATLKINGSTKTEIGYSTGSGAYLQNGVSPYHTLFIGDSGSFKFNTYDIYHSGNCNNVSTPWYASGIRFNSGGGCTICAGNQVTSGLGANDIGLRAYDGSNYSKIRVWCSYFELAAGAMAIGKVSPNYALDVVGSIYASSDIYTYESLYFTRSSYSYIVQQSGALSFNTGSAGGADSKILLNANGNVSIGYFGDAGYKLYVAGGFCTTGDQVISSDINKKTNFVPIKLSVNEIANAPAVTFDWKAGGHSFGSIAQYWKPLLGEMVLGEEGNYTLAYAQGAFVNAIINARAIVALQDHETEQDKEIRELKEKVKKQAGEIRGLRKEIERLNSRSYGME